MSEIELNPHYLFINSDTISTLTSTKSTEILQVPAGQVRIEVNSMLSLLGVDKVSDVTVNCDGDYLYSDIVMSHGEGGEL